MGTTVQNTEVKLPSSLNRLSGNGLVVGIVALLVGLGLGIGIGGADLFFQAYLYSFVLWISIPMGSFALLMIHHMTAGSWSFIIQRLLEASTRTIKYMALLFVPIALGPLIGLHGLYEGWVHPEHEFVEAKTAFLNVEFWCIRAIIYFTIWIGLAYLFNKWSKQLDEQDDPFITIKFRRLAPPGLILYCITMTLAATDWVMSLEPEWFSTIYGPLFWMSQALTTFAFMILVLAALAETKPISHYLTVDHFYQLGTFMLAFTVLWAYMSFSQFLIIWSGNLGEEIGWYTIARMDGGMSVVGVLLMVGHFLIPLFYLLQRRFKFNVSRLKIAACWMLSWRLVDVFYIVNPAFHHSDPGVHLSDVAVYSLVFVGMGGVWLWLFVNQLRKRPLLALNDPRLHKALSHGGSGAQVSEHA